MQSKLNFVIYSQCYNIMNLKSKVFKFFDKNKALHQFLSVVLHKTFFSCIETLKLNMFSMNSTS